jgi:hypothetical protein
LDSEIGNSELLMSVAPLRLVTTGDVLAIRICHTRDACYDFTCMLDPDVSAAKDYLGEFCAAVARTNDKGGLPPDWLSQELEKIIRRRRRMDFFLQSVEQDIIVYGGLNLMVYAPLLSCALERKMRRIALTPQQGWAKAMNISDAAGIVRLMRKPEDPPLSFQYIRDLNFNGFEPPSTDEAILKVAYRYREIYGEVGLAEMIWDTGLARWKYQDLNGNWVWC